MTASTTANACIHRTAMPGLGPYSAPRAGVEQTLTRLWCESFGMDQVGIDDDFFALGGTSIQAVHLFDAIEKECQRRLPLALLYEAPTIRSLARLLGDESQPAPAGRCLVRIEAGNDNGPPLFLVPGMGGNVVGLAHLGRELATEGPVFGLQSPGLEGRDAPLHDLREIAARYLDEIRSLRHDRPPRLLGICWGALVALEMAQQLTRGGEAVGSLLMMDPPPPGHPGPAWPGHLQHGIALPRFVASRLSLYWRSLRALPPEERRRYLRERVRVVQDIVRRRDIFRGDRSEFARREVTAANASAARHYVPQPFDAGAYLLFTADRPDGRSRRYRAYWQDLVAAGHAPRFVPGHDTGEAIAPERAAIVAATVRECLRPNGRETPAGQSGR